MTAILFDRYDMTPVITNGTPGSITDADVCERIDYIEMHPSLRADQKYELLDLFWFFVGNNHALGYAAPILDAIRDASIQWLYRI